MIFILILLSQLDSNPLMGLKEKPFKTSFIEIVRYKEVETQDTFRGTITRKGSNVTMEVSYPSKETYVIKNDTLFIKSQGKESSYPLEEDALKFLNFQFLADSTNYEIRMIGDTINIKSKEETFFLAAKLIIQNGVPKALLIEDQEKVLKFFFSRWKFYE